jgi:hypothetical protein
MQVMDAAAEHLRGIYPNWTIYKVGGTPNLRIWNGKSDWMFFHAVLVPRRLSEHEKYILLALEKAGLPIKVLSVRRVRRHGSKTG